MPTPMMNASELAAPLRAHLPKGTALSWLLRQMVTTAKFLLTCQPAKHLSKFVTLKL